MVSMERMTDSHIVDDDVDGGDDDVDDAAA